MKDYPSQKGRWIEESGQIGKWPIVSVGRSNGMKWNSRI